MTNETKQIISTPIYTHTFSKVSPPLSFGKIKQNKLNNSKGNSMLMQPNWINVNIHPYFNFSLNKIKRINNPYNSSFKYSLKSSLSQIQVK